VRFRQADHALELTRGGGDAALGGADVFAELAHGDVGGDEGFAGGGGDGGLDVGAGVGDVGSEEFDGLGEWLVKWWERRGGVEVLTKISSLLALSGVSSRYMPTKWRASLRSVDSSMRSRTR